MMKFLIYRPIGVVMTFVAFVILGAIAYTTLPVSLMPDIPIPQVTVRINYPNTSAREFEDGIVRTVRNQLMQVQHLDEIVSKTKDGYAAIDLHFDFGAEIDYAFIEVNEKMDAIMNVLPRDMERPKVLKVNATDIPVFYINVSIKETETSDTVDTNMSQNFRQLSNFAESVIRRRIEQLPDVSLVDISGNVGSQLVIQPDMAMLNNLGASVDDIEQALAENNISIGNLTMREGQYQYNLRFASTLRNVNDVKNIRLHIADRVYRLSDIAHVTIDDQSRFGLFEANSKPALSLAVIKQADSKIADMSKNISGLLESMSAEHPKIKFEISQDQTQLLNYSIESLRSNLMIGMLLVVLVVVLFLKELKLPVIIGCSLLVSIIISMLFFKLSGLSINIISLAGLILATGNMMDNAIVVVDNIMQHREEGDSLDNACIHGTIEIWLPQLSSILVNVVVFIPLIFLSGVAGALLYDQAIAVTIGLSVSFLVGIILIPVLFRIFYLRNGQTLNRKENLNQKKLISFSAVERVYKVGLALTFRYKFVSALCFMLVLPLTIPAFRKIKKEKLPHLTQTEFYIDVDWAENIHINDNRARVRKMLESLQPYIITSEAYVGRQQYLLSGLSELEPNQARIYLKVRKPEDIERVTAIASRYISYEYPDAKVAFEPPTSIFEKIFGNASPPLVAEISSIDEHHSIDPGHAAKLADFFDDDSVADPMNRVPVRSYLAIRVNLERLALYRVSMDVLIKELKLALGQRRAGILHSFREFLPIVIVKPPLGLTQLLETTRVPNADGTLVPISVFVELEKFQELKTITAGRYGEYIPLAFFPKSNDHAAVMSKVSKIINTSENLKVNFSGSIFVTEKLLEEISQVLIVSVLLLYFILAALFESLLQPLIVLLEIPLAVGASLITLLITGQSLNLMSASAMVVMLGIIITDSILKLDAINHLYRRGGYQLTEAIHEGGRKRLRAILMTSLTSILAMVPLLFGDDMGSELQKPFSYALIGGMVFGTLVSLYLVPLCYWYLYKRGESSEVK